MEEDIFKRFREASLKQMKMCVPEITNPELLSKEITIVFRFGTEVTNIVKKIQDELYLLSPSLFYYPESQLHMTVIGKIPIDMKTNVLLETITELIKNKTLRFKFFGTGMGKFSTSLSGYPVGFSLKELRTSIRQRLNIQGSDFTIHLQDYEYVGWMNFVRNVSAIPSTAFREKVLEYKDKTFGEFNPHSIEVLENESWVLDPQKSKSLTEIIV